MSSSNQLVDSEGTTKAAAQDEPIAMSEEDAVPPVSALDPDLFAPGPTESEFLRRLISPDKEVVKDVVTKMQIKAYEIFPYPCILKFGFVTLRSLNNSAYQPVLEDGKADPTAIHLDLGCCMGTDVRKLALDGYPAHNIVGCDLVQAFIDLGYELYSDKDTCAIKFIVSDVFDLPPTPSPTPSSTPISEAQSLHDLTGRVKHIYTGSLFHLFDEAAQMAIAVRLVILLRPNTSGAIIYGQHVGFEKEGQMIHPLKRMRYAHSPASWKKMWLQAFATVRGEEYARGHVIVEAELKPSDAGRSKYGERILTWNVRLTA